MARAEQVLGTNVREFLASIGVRLTRAQATQIDAEADGWIAALKDQADVDNPLVSYMRRRAGTRNVRVIGTGFTSGKALVQYEDDDEVAYVRTEDMGRVV
jgi:hypothetical protein